MLQGIFVHVDVSDFQLAAVCKLWSSVFQDRQFWKIYCKNHWNVTIDEMIIKDIRKYIFERYNLENMPLRMLSLIRSYHESLERTHLKLLRSLIAQEEFISESKERMLEWINDMPFQTDKQILANLLRIRLCYEDYDNIVSQDSGALLFGEGWNGSYRIYDNKGSYITVSFDCYCHQGHEKEHLKLSYRKYEESEIHLIISADAQDEDSYIYNSHNVHKLREHLELEKVTLTNLFCFLLFSMGKLLEFYRFRCLGTEQFSEFWHDLERFEITKKTLDSPDQNENQQFVEDE